MNFVQQTEYGPEKELTIFWKVRTNAGMYSTE